MIYCPIINSDCRGMRCRFYTEQQNASCSCAIKNICFLGQDIIKAATILRESIKEASSKEEKITIKSDLDKCIKTFVDGSSALSVMKE